MAVEIATIAASMQSSHGLWVPYVGHGEGGNGNEIAEEGGWADWKMTVPLFGILTNTMCERVSQRNNR